MELGEAEPLGILDEHDARVGDIDADLDDGRAYQNIQFAVFESCHHCLFFRRFESAVQETDTERREYFFQFFCFCRGSFYPLLQFLPTCGGGKVGGD